MLPLLIFLCALSFYFFLFEYHIDVQFLVSLIFHFQISDEIVNWINYRLKDDIRYCSTWEFPSCLQHKIWNSICQKLFPFTVNIYQIFAFMENLSPNFSDLYLAVNWDIYSRKMTEFFIPWKYN